MTILDLAKQSSIVVDRPQRPDRIAVRLARSKFTDEQMEIAGTGASAKVARGTPYDFCGTLHNCTTYTTTCPRVLDIG